MPQPQTQTRYPLFTERNVKKGALGGEDSTMERRLDDRFINIFPMPHSAPLRFPLTETVCKEIATAGRSKLIDNFY